MAAWSPLSRSLPTNYPHADVGMPPESEARASYLLMLQFLSVKLIVATARAVFCSLH